jgi:hypothetical protein
VLVELSGSKNEIFNIAQNFFIFYSNFLALLSGIHHIATTNSRKIPYVSSLQMHQTHNKGHSLMAVLASFPRVT